MYKLIDYFLDRITMYRLVLYSLIALLGISIVLSYIGTLSFTPFSLIISSLYLVAVCYIANKVISSAFNAPTNVESFLITALILALIVNPAQNFSDFVFLFWVGVLAMASKFILAYRKKHIFNPAAIALVITGFAINQGASWWIGTSYLMPFVLISGILIIRKLRFEDLAWSFFTVAFITSMGITLLRGGDLYTTLLQIVFRSSFLFLGSIMLTEPYTLPPRKNLQMVYGAIVGFLSVPQVHFGSLYFAPEMALCIGNIFSFIVSPKTKLVLHLSEKKQISSDVYDFLFNTQKKVTFIPGQYMEWTLPHNSPDSRGNRRFFTLASSPTEDTIRLGVKFYDKGSTYKKAMLQLDDKTPVVGAQIAGNFTLPKNPHQKIAFLAGGIGITPFRSMIKYLVDTKQKRDIVLMYSNKSEDEIVYADVFKDAAATLGIKTVYTLTNAEIIRPDWMGKRGRIDAQMIASEIPDYKERLFYLSGPFVMITAFEKTLHEMGVRKEQIKKDYFPGLV